MSGLPSEGASEGNQYTPDAQRPNCLKVSLCPAWGRVQFGFSSVNITSMRPIFAFALPTNGLVGNVQCSDEGSTSQVGRKTEEVDINLKYFLARVQEA